MKSLNLAASIVRRRPYSEWLNLVSPLGCWVYICQHWWLLLREKQKRWWWYCWRSNYFFLTVHMLTSTARRDEVSIWNEGSHRQNPWSRTVREMLYAHLKLHFTEIFLWRTQESWHRKDLSFSHSCIPDHVPVMQYSDSGWFTCQLYPGSFQNEARSAIPLLVITSWSYLAETQNASMTGVLIISSKSRFTDLNGCSWRWLLTDMIIVLVRGLTSCPFRDCSMYVSSIRQHHSGKYYGKYVLMFFTSVIILTDVSRIRTYGKRHWWFFTVVWNTTLDSVDVPVGKGETPLRCNFWTMDCFCRSKAGLGPADMGKVGGWDRARITNFSKLTDTLDDWRYW